MAALKWYGDKIIRRCTASTDKMVPCLAKTIVRTARRLVPVGKGTLRDSIRTEGGQAIAGGIKAPYAGVVELGAAKRAAQPFMRPAAESLSRSDLEKCLT